MDFEYDSKKSQSNLEKHGIDFKTAKEAWLDSEAVQIPAKTVGEPRIARVAKIGGKIWTVIFTYRGETVRIISARRAQEKEEGFYYG